MADLAVSAGRYADRNYQKFPEYMRCELICDEVFKRALAGGSHVFLGKARAAIVAGLCGEIVDCRAKSM